MKAPQRYDGKTMKRPFFVAVLLIVFAILLTQWSNSALLGLGIFGAGFVACYLSKEWKYRKEVMVLLIVASFFVCYTYWTLCCPYGLRAYNEQRVNVVFQVLSETEQRGKYAQTTVLVYGVQQKSETKMVRQKMLLRVYGEMTPMRPGDFYQAKMKVFEPRKAEEKGEFDYNLYLKSQRIYSIANVSSNEITKLSKGHLPFFIDKIIDIKSSIIENMRRFMPGEGLMIVRGIMWGDRMEEGQIKNDLTVVGAAHILSVSGLHVGFIYLLINFLLKRTKWDKKKQMLIVMAVLLMYAAMSAFAISVLRACMMFAILQMAKIRKKVYDPLSAISLAAIIVLLLNPLVLFTASFQLSFLSVAGIIFFVRVVNLQFGSLPRAVRSVVQTMTITICVQLCILPILLYHFAEISLISVFANVVIIPLTGAIVITAFFGMFFCFLPFMQPYFAFLTVQVYVLQVVAAKFASAKYAALTLSAMPLSMAIAFYICLFALFGYFPFQKIAVRRMVALSLALCAFGFVLQMVVG